MWTSPSKASLALDCERLLAWLKIPAGYSSAFIPGIRTPGRNAPRPLLHALMDRCRTASVEKPASPR
eukprot:15084220-Alexandrium_andersonii.AAC.1